MPATPRPAASPAADTAHLQKRNLTWLCVVAVPRPLRATMGKAKLLRSLQTGDLRTAQRRRHAVLADFQGQIEAARKEAVGGPQTAVADAMEYRAMAEELDAQEDGTGVAAFTGTDLLQHRAEAIEREKGLAASARFFAIASGTGTPIAHYIEAWLTEGNYPPRSKIQHRTTVKELEGWCAVENLAPDLEAITKKAAGRFASAAGEARAVTRSTVNRKLSSLRSYWRWLEKKGHVETNPWLGQSLPKPRQDGDDDGSRTWTEKEAVALLSGDAGPLLHDFMRMAALTGARIGALANLTVADSREGWFNIRKDKTKAGRRRVPIHSDLAALVERRSAGKPETAYLFDELTTDKQGERSSFISKSFTVYRQRLGIAEKDAGQRRSLVTFHSWRHWFITTARNAGQDEATVQQVVGQKPQSVMGRVYFGGREEAALRACVEAVKLPAHTASEHAPKTSPKPR